ncbi:hypothetical protein E7Y32_08560 [Arthrobacter sp. UKPF54-2]|uniref:hypothetical protein n=1 Tax=Arthrobacter sp. UKPF54-2 TaxID=2600159 RepID=UPI0011B132BA|nr:hypothetical protein [Arthrobacter sp. UKPF54-2]QDY90253.1 hypothetical protein E7Y32_08560 [Arthrobacter sp. UKPF54-2]
MAKVSARTATWAKWAAVPAALLVSGVAVSQASYSAFSATTESAANSWKSGTVAISSTADKNTGTATFAAENLKPGSTASKCITVTSSGSLASTVKLYAKGFTNDAKDLASYIDLAIYEGTGGNSACEGFTASTPATPAFAGTVAAFGTKNTGFSSGVGSWVTKGASAETRTYQITYTVKPEAPNSTQGGTAAVGFTWEAQNS